MKRILVTLLLLLYMGISSGATVHLHYCMGQLVDLGIGHQAKAPCPLCKTPKKACGKLCCKDDFKQAKIDKSQKASQVSYQFKQEPSVQHERINYNIFYVKLPFKLSKATFSNAPPSLDDIPVFIRNCTYRI